MAVRIRPVRVQEEYDRALGAIGHYFGGGWSPEEKERFARLLPHERMLASFDGEAIVAGAGSFPFQLTVPGAQLPCAGVSVVGVLPTHRRQGILGRLMRAQLEDVRERGEPVAALWASEEAIYRRFGYGLAAQDAMIRAKRGDAALAADLPGRAGTLRLVDHEEALAAFPRIYDRVRRGTTGFVSRSREWWEIRTLADTPERRRGAGELNRVLLELDGQPAGYALYRITFRHEDAANRSQVQVIEAIGDSPVATRELWRYLLAIDWVDEIRHDLLPVDHPLFLLVERPNSLHWKVFDGLWLRLVDVGAALAARAVNGDARVTVEVAADPLLPENTGTWTVEGGDAKRTSRRADVRLDVQALASAYLGGFTFIELARAGRVAEVARGGLARADRAFHVDARPWCPEVF